MISRPYRSLASDKGNRRDLFDQNSGRPISRRLIAINRPTWTWTTRFQGKPAKIWSVALEHGILDSAKKQFSQVSQQLNTNVVICLIYCTDNIVYIGVYI